MKDKQIDLDDLESLHRAIITLQKEIEGLRFNDAKDTAIYMRKMIYDHIRSMKLNDKVV